MYYFQGFQSYQSRQINPEFLKLIRYISSAIRFQSYQSRQINPDYNNIRPRCTEDFVSIVSIQTDQSRRVRLLMASFLTRRFNRINPDRSIPTCSSKLEASDLLGFQSYQSRQINPDTSAAASWIRHSLSFNRINPDRSIPTSDESWGFNCYYLFQSYQSRQINSDLSCRECRESTFSSFNRINPNRSIPTQVHDYKYNDRLKVSIVSIQTDQSRHEYDLADPSQMSAFQSYQFRQINPDCYLCEARRGAALWGRMAEPIFWRTKWLKNIQQILYNPG